MKKVFALILSLLMFVTFSFSVLGCKKKEAPAPEAPKVEAPAPAAPAAEGTAAPAEGTAAPAAPAPAAEKK